MAKEEDVQLEKSRINLFNAVGFAALAVSQAITGTVLYVNLKRDVGDASKAVEDVKMQVQRETEVRRQRSAETTESFEEVKEQIKPLANLTYRLEQNETRTDEAHARIDRLHELVSQKFDGLFEGVAGIKSDVRLLSQKIDTLTGAPAQRTKFKLPVEPWAYTPYRREAQKTPQATVPVP